MYPLLPILYIIKIVLSARGRIVASVLEAIWDMPVETTGAVHGIAQSAGSRVGDYAALLKPRVMSLVVFTGFAGLVVTPGGLHPLRGTTAVLCIAVGAGAAGAINMWYDRDINALMERTRKRPIPAGRVAPDKALAFGITLALLSVMLMGVTVNWPLLHCSRLPSASMFSSILSG